LSLEQKERNRDEPIITEGSEGCDSIPKVQCLHSGEEMRENGIVVAELQSGTVGKLIYYHSCSKSRQTRVGGWKIWTNRTQVLYYATTIHIWFSRDMEDRPQENEILSNTPSHVFRLLEYWESK
jgi:hypothetical protein